MVIVIIPFICLAEQYTLEQLIEVGLERSYDIQSSNVNKLNSGSNFRRSLYGLLPSMSVGLNKSKQYSSVYIDSLENRISYSTDWSESGSLTISKAFSLNEPSFYNISEAIYNMKNSKLSFEDSQKEVAYYVFSYYLSVIEAEETLEIQQKNLELQTKIHQQIQVQFDTGNKSILELKQSELSLIDYEIAVNEASNSLSTTRRGLFSYLNMDDEGYDFDDPEIEVEIKDLEFVTNSSLKQKENSLKINKLYQFQTLMNFLPTLSVSYNVGHSDYNDIYAFSDYYRASNQLSLNASWEIFNLLDNYESFIQNKRNLKLQKLDLKISEKSNKNELSNLQSDLKTLKRSYDLYEEKMLLAKQNLEMAQEQFRLGMISLLDLDRSKIDYQNTQLSNIQNKYELLKKQEEINLLLSEKILGKW